MQRSAEGTGSAVHAAPSERRLQKWVQSLKDHFDGMKAVELPRAKSDWEHLYFSNFSSVAAYDSALRRIVSQLKLCDQEVTDEEMIEKTLSTIPPSQLMLHRMLRVANYRAYSELVCVLLQVEKDEQKLRRNHDANPTHQKAASKRKRRRSQSRRSNNWHLVHYPGTSFVTALSTLLTMW